MKRGTRGCKGGEAQRLMADFSLCSNNPERCKGW